ncbi:hypothetical protein OV079_17215 [Nannocystis pusilla]|uniref:Uncharacterized protein n=1 Tax=Nannocystis pusilla TaxID=889268 RepID=A0A9X3EX81_9BACT|nr:hypothetical protein [Nannocystis pusilla]MCY1007263.1 hypothetical protein [Nannocystis pusilla]
MHDPAHRPELARLAGEVDQAGEAPERRGGQERAEERGAGAERGEEGRQGDEQPERAPQRRAGGDEGGEDEEREHRRAQCTRPAPRSTSWLVGQVTSRARRRAAATIPRRARASAPGVSPTMIRRDRHVEGVDSRRVAGRSRRVARRREVASADTRQKGLAAVRSEAGWAR